MAISLKLLFSSLNILLICSALSLQTSQIRRYIVCAVLRGVTFDEVRYNSFIDLQDQLHHNIYGNLTRPWEIVILLYDILTMNIATNWDVFWQC